MPFVVENVGIFERRICQIKPHIGRHIRKTVSSAGDSVASVNPIIGRAAVDIVGSGVPFRLATDISDSVAL